MNNSYKTVIHQDQESRSRITLFAKCISRYTGIWYGHQLHTNSHRNMSKTRLL